MHIILEIRKQREGQSWHSVCCPAGLAGKKYSPNGGQCWVWVHAQLSSPDTFQVPDSWPGGSLSGLYSSPRPPRPKTERALFLFIPFPFRSLDINSGPSRDRPQLFPNLGIHPAWERKVPWAQCGKSTSSWGCPSMALLVLSPSRYRWSQMATWRPGTQPVARPERGNPSIPGTLAHITTSAWEKGRRKVNVSESLLYIHYFTYCS